jgi:hypothetical protein
LINVAYLGAVIVLSFYYCLYLIYFRYFYTLGTDLEKGIRYIENALGLDKVLLPNMELDIGENNIIGFLDTIKEEKSEKRLKKESFDRKKSSSQVLEEILSLSLGENEVEKSIKRRRSESELNPIRPQADEKNKTKVLKRLKSQITGMHHDDFGDLF